VGPDDEELVPERRDVQSFVVVKSEGTWRVALFQNTRVRTRSSGK
jgi:hypothetical protein